MLVFVSEIDDSCWVLFVEQVRCCFAVWSDALPPKEVESNRGQEEKRVFRFVYLGFWRRMTATFMTMVLGRISPWMLERNNC